MLLILVTQQQVEISSKQSFVVFFSCFALLSFLFGLFIFNYEVNICNMIFFRKRQVSVFFKAQAQTHDMLDSHDQDFLTVTDVTDDEDEIFSTAPEFR